MNGSRFNYEDYAYEPGEERIVSDYYLATETAPLAPRLAPDIHATPAEGILSRPVGELIENSVLSRPVGELLSAAVRKRHAAG